MGCASSKRIEVAAIDVYRPPPTSFGKFDINSIEEPWLKALEAHQPTEEEDHEQSAEKEKRMTTVPTPLLEKLNAIEDVAPRSWDEVSKALNDLKNNPPPKSNPILLPSPPPPPTTTLEPNNIDKLQNSPAPAGPPKSFSFHTLEELEAKLSAKPPAGADHTPPKKTKPATHAELKKHGSSAPEVAAGVVGGGIENNNLYKPVKENIFILRDKMEREKEGKSAAPNRFNPLNDFPEICPPGGEDSVVIYTTSLGGVRRTFEDCNQVRLIMESHRFVFEERDVSLHGQFLNELKDLLGEGVSVPRMFVKGRYLGGVDEVVNLNETGRLRRILNWARVEKGVGRLGCEGCGGARFVPCLDCGGSCKVVVVVGDDNNKDKQIMRCPSCNENGLMLCPLCA